ncbi:DNA primase large subunit-like [Aphis gossypii]|uniref:DNA primase large subunit-like n=1 Tax=Aphis gossypii TaxID=80765 RepID=UPI00215972F0|nr:DNA primase large subunit-like [Aphis gossypii]XP_050055393.1 DNA primase large subunit-like [Aphis gossypii]
MFYLQVPDINISILDIEDSALSRLGHFATYSKLTNKQNHLRYLRNSSLLDYSGFLSLRTHASLTDDQALKEMVIEGECRLISERLNLMKPNYLRKYLIKIIDDIRLFDVTNDNIDVLLKFCSEYKDKQHVPCNEHCSAQSIEVPWQKCLTLVSNRKVHLNQGIAIVPCNQWNSVLVDLFRIIYIKSLRTIRRSMSASNSNNLQIEYLSEKINGYYNSKIAFWKNIDKQVSLEELISNKISIPPCMLLSLNSLFTNHRLAHDPRYRLTLFLKDIGIPFEQTLALFQQEYSKCGNLGSACTHSWDKHHKQIEYNVRHTYGMVGSKKDYQMTSCVLMQKQNIQVPDEGCCPFVHCSKDKLKNILEEFVSIDDDEMNIINDLKNSDQPIQACHRYAHKLFQTSKSLYHNTPTQYFFNSKKAII